MTAYSSGPLTAEQMADLRLVELPNTLLINESDHTNDFTTFIDELAAKWVKSGRISEAKQGFGFATTGLIHRSQLRAFNLENPLNYIAAAFAHDGAPQRCMWNAVRKIYALLQLLQKGYDVASTLEAAGLMPPAVESQNPDGTISMGPFSWGGAYLQESGDFVIIDSFSIWKATEDHGLARRSAQWQLNVHGVK